MPILWGSDPSVYTSGSLWPGDGTPGAAGVAAPLGEQIMVLGAPSAVAPTPPLRVTVTYRHRSRVRLQVAARAEVAVRRAPPIARPAPVFPAPAPLVIETAAPARTLAVRGVSTVLVCGAAATARRRHREAQGMACVEAAPRGRVWHGTLAALLAEDEELMVMGLL